MRMIFNLFSQYYLLALQLLLVWMPPFLHYRDYFRLRFILLAKLSLRILRCSQPHED